MTKSIETDKGAQSERNPVKIVFIVVAVLTSLYFITSMTALIFPESGIPFVWTAFPIAPQGPPISPESMIP
jgi:hypothetical protein